MEEERETLLRACVCLTSVRPSLLLVGERGKRDEESREREEFQFHTPRSRRREREGGLLARARPFRICRIRFQTLSLLVCR